MRKHSVTMVFLAVLIVLGIGVSIYTCYAVWLTRDTTPLTILIPSVFSAVDVTVAAVIWKRRTNNMLDFFMDKRLKDVVTFLNDHGIDVADFFRAFKE